MADIDKAYSWAISTCNAPNVGYSQAYRNQRTINGITYYDCSSFINYALLAGGFVTPQYAPKNNAFTTYIEPNVLFELGFKEVDAKGVILPGDIGLIPGHTEMCYKGGIGRGVFMGAHTDNAPLAYQVSIGSTTGNENYTSSWNRIFRYGQGGAESYGYSIYVVCALAGNAWRESHINPTLYQQNGSAFGMFQWDGTRRDALLTWLDEHGYEKDDPIGQMEYLVYEGDWIGTYAGISSLDEFLNSQSTDITSLTEAFCNCWERPGLPAMQERIDFALDAYDYIIQHAQDTSISQWETLPMYYLSRGQALKNAVLMYRYYSNGGGGGGTPGRKRKHIPVWMLIKYHY